MLKTVPYTRNANVLYFGSDNFSAKCLETLLSLNKNVHCQSLFNSISVITSPKSPQTSTDLPVQSLCKQKNITYWEAPPKTLSNWNLPGIFDFGIVISFGYFIPKRILHQFSMGIINLHPSRLPELRGPAPMIHALARGDCTGGVSIVELHPERFDAGRVLKQSSFALPAEWSYAELERKVVQVGVEDLVCVMEDFPAYFANATSQLDEFATQAPKVDRSFASVSFAAMTRNQIINRYRAIRHVFPLEATFFLSPSKQIRVKLVEIDMLAQLANTKQRNERVVYDKRNKLIFIRCACNGWLGVSKMRVIGKSMLYNAAQFTCGYQFDASSYFD